MDRYWRNLLSAQGGAGGWSLAKMAGQPDIRRVSRKPTVFEDLHGVRFTVRDIREEVPWATYKTVVSAVSRCSTVEDVRQWLLSSKQR